ncbi:MAG: DnaB-like helicase C-terminal domain-containing protein [Elusimicrobiota bacterium]|nr:DnaB-like helicase C-terminal domain-containing protein [Elusimicrobiota bacterium]
MITGSGFADLDVMLGGGLPSGLLSIGAGCSQGTTSFLLTAALNIALGKDPAGVAIFAPASTRPRVLAKLIGLESGIAPGYYSIMRPGVPDWPAVLAASSRISSARIYVDATPVTVDMLCERALGVSEELRGLGQHLGLIAVDDLFLLKIARREFRKGGPSMGEELLLRLRELSQKVQAPVLVTFKLSRRTRDLLERDKLKKIEIPKAIAKAADAVLLLQRDSMGYNPEANVCGFIVKNEHGKCGRLWFKAGNSGRFLDAVKTADSQVSEIEATTRYFEPEL